MNRIVKQVRRVTEMELNKETIGCPQLRSEAYTANTLEYQLADNSRHFFSVDRNLRIDGDTIWMSSLLDWFGGDFVDSQSERLSHLRPYLPQAVQELAERRGVRVQFLPNDWSLNDQLWAADQ